MNSTKVRFVIPILVTIAFSCAGQWQGKFEPLGQLLPTPNAFRTGSGAPGSAYWQQQADYTINVELDDASQTIRGSETITYHNNAPEPLAYLWLQLDQNIVDAESLTPKTEATTIGILPSTRDLTNVVNLSVPDGGFTISSLRDATGKALPYTVNHTMMRIDLPQLLLSGHYLTFSIDWSFPIVDRMKSDQRSGMEYFPEDGNYVYTIAQFFPRMCSYDDLEGWQNKQYLGGAEFALPFGDYRVRITVPADHVVAATGVLQNPQAVLSATEQERLERSKTSFQQPVMIVTQAEAVQKEKAMSPAKKTWEFKADQVRDFAFASSRKFIWEAMAVKIGNRTPQVMSFYPREGNPLWEREASLAARNALEVYSRFTIDYPYPVANVIHAASIGMEYPMICFDRGRPYADGTYSAAKRQDMISVIVHEVGHNFFPMIVNSDERACAWMDEGINSFLQLLTEQERYPDLTWTRGVPAEMVPYMSAARDTHRPLMTDPEQVVELGAEQYAKAATAFYVLRETIMGHDLFDHAFKAYAQRWAFRHPKPADFFRTMEDASAMDLDWFWRGWFFTTDVVDLSVDDVKWYRMTDPQQVETTVVASGKTPGSGDNALAQKPNRLRVMPADEMEYREFKSRLDDRKILDEIRDRNFYEVTFSNKGGLAMPIIIQWTYRDGTQEIEKLPAEIWRKNENKVTKVFLKEKEVAEIQIDPFGETTDINEGDNAYPRRETPDRLDTFREK